jgi:hypothetical protein
MIICLILLINSVKILHVHTSNLDKINPESYRIPKSKIRSFNMLTTNEINLLLPSMQIELSPDRFKPLYKYENMSNAQIQLNLKMIPIDQKETVISTVLNQAINTMMSAKNRSNEEFKFDIDTKIKLAVIYNNFQDTFPDLYGNLKRYVSVKQHTLLIFDTYFIYVVFSCDTQKRTFEKYEQTDSIVIGGEVTKKEKWKEEIDIDFVKNKGKKMEN